MEKLGVAILGLDHWYSADHMAPAVIDSAVTRLVAVSHDDLAKGRQLIRNADEGFWTSDYRAALDRKDVDIVVLLYSTDRNPAICQEAAALGKHIVSVKPMALDLAGADAIVAAVRAAGVQFYPLESQRRLNPDHRRIKSWLDEGRIGRPLRFTQMLHGSLPMAGQRRGGLVDGSRARAWRRVARSRDLCGGQRALAAGRRDGARVRRELQP